MQFAENDLDNRIPAGHAAFFNSFPYTRLGYSSNYLREVKSGDPLRFEARLLDFDAKRIHFYQEMFHATEGYLAASQESLSAHVSMAARRISPFPAELLERLTAIKAAHAALVRPWQIGHVIQAAGLKRAGG